MEMDFLRHGMYDEKKKEVLNKLNPHAISKLS